MEYTDPHTSTLLQLLKNISEEVEDLCPNPTSSGISAPGNKSPLASLNTKLQKLASNQSTSPKVQRGPMGNLITTKAKSTSPPKIIKQSPVKKSSSQEDFKIPKISLEPVKQGNDFGEILNLPVSESQKIMPLIQITLTESQEKKKFSEGNSNSKSPERLKLIKSNF